MAKDNSQIIFYQQGVAAGQQVDKYSSQPGCVDSKNLDIFSDSQSVKAMAWSNKSTVDPDIIDTDPRERFQLYYDGRVYDTKEEVRYNHDYFDAHANQINYQDGHGYVTPSFGTPKKLMVAYQGDDWKTITIITDRLIYNIYSDWVRVTAGGGIFGVKQGETCKNQEGYDVSATSTVTDNTGTRTKYVRAEYGNTAGQVYQSPGGFHALADADQKNMRAKIDIHCDASKFTDVDIRVGKTKLSWDNVDKVFDNDYGTADSTFHYDEIASDTHIQLEVYFDNNEEYYDYFLGNTGVYFHGTCKTPAAWVNVSFYKKEDWEYLYPLDRKFITIDDELYMEVNDPSEFEMLKYYAKSDEDGNTYYELYTGNLIQFPDDQEIVAFARGFDYTYIFANKGDMGIAYYATDVNLATFNVGYRFPGTKFINAIMIGNYVYVIAEKRGVRGLYIFSNGDMKLLVGADKRHTEGLDLVNGEEIYNFTGLMANWRDHVVCSTKNEIFMYGRNKLGMNVGAFILQVNGEILDIKTDRGYLDVYFEDYSIVGNSRKTLQDDVNIRRYESDFNVIYPLQISSYINEKEPLKLGISYFLPNSVTKLEAYLSVNDYYFWSFNTNGQTTPTVGDKFKMVGCSGTYWLVFVEKRDGWLTFKLEGNLPYQISNAKQLKSEDNTVTINYFDFNHFKYIGECVKTDFAEIAGKHILHNITSVNDLPMVRKAQVKIIGKTDNAVSPELYDVRLLSNQYDK